MKIHPSYTAFAGHQQLITADLEAVAIKVKSVVDGERPPPVLIFDDFNGEQIDVDLRGTSADVVRQLHRQADRKAAEELVAQSSSSRSAGRPKLGVVAREVTLLPRHWEWLSRQSGGASAALRRLVEHASRASEAKDRARHAQEAAYRFMTAMAGNETGFEEATRALFAGHGKRFVTETESWPQDVRDYARKLAAPAFADHAESAAQ